MHEEIATLGDLSRGDEFCTLITGKIGKVIGEMTGDDGIPVVLIRKSETTFNPGQLKSIHKDVRVRHVW